MIRRRLSHISPEELLLVPIVVIIIAAVIWQPTAITRLFEGPYATPIPGDSPADVILRTPAPSPSPVGAETPRPAPELLHRAPIVMPLDSR